MIASLLLLSVLAPVSSRAQGPPPSPVRVDAVRREVVQEVRSVTGEVRPRRRSFVAPREAGLVLEVTVRPGDVVQEGALLARLDGTRLELALETLNAQRRAGEVGLEQRREEAAQADRDLAVARELASKGTVGQKQLTDSTSAAKVAHIRVSQAESELAVLAARQRELARRLEDLSLVAPFAGAVVAKLAEVGEWLEIGKPVVELVSASELEVWLNVPQRHAGALAAAGESIVVRIEAVGLELPLAAGRTVPQVDANARTFKYVLDLPREALQGPESPDPIPVAAGMSVVADVPTGQRDEHWTVARDAILRRESGSFLFVARAVAAPEGEDGEGRGEDAPPAHQAVRIAVTYLFSTGGRAVVRANGLQAGDLAVVEGHERLFPGAPIVPVTSATTEGR